MFVLGFVITRCLLTKQYVWLNIFIIHNANYPEKYNYILACGKLIANIIKIILDFLDIIRNINNYICIWFATNYYIRNDKLSNYYKTLIRIVIIKRELAIIRDMTNSFKIMHIAYFLSHWSENSPKIWMS